MWCISHPLKIEFSLNQRLPASDWTSYSLPNCLAVLRACTLDREEGEFDTRRQASMVPDGPQATFRRDCHVRCTEVVTDSGGALALPWCMSGVEGG